MSIMDKRIAGVPLPYIGVGAVALIGGYFLLSRGSSAPADSGGGLPVIFASGGSPAPNFNADATTPTSGQDDTVFASIQASLTSALAQVSAAAQGAHDDNATALFLSMPDMLAKNGIDRVSGTSGAGDFLSSFDFQVFYHNNALPTPTPAPTPAAAIDLHPTPQPTSLESDIWHTAGLGQGNTEYWERVYGHGISPREVQFNMTAGS